MGRFSRIGWWVLGCALLGCGKSKPSEPAAAPVARAPSQQVEAAEESLYDAQGRLKASAERAEWLQIPVGFKRKPSIDERHVRFEAGPLPLDKVRDFLAARMFTGTVEEQDNRVFYRAVMPIDGDPKAVRLHVALSRRPGLRGLLLEIERLTYDDVKPISVEEARRVLTHERARAE